ncbi:acyltransferase family protein, partial [Cellulosimicrobium funkei]
MFSYGVWLTRTSCRAPPTRSTEFADGAPPRAATADQRSEEPHAEALSPGVAVPETGAGRYVLLEPLRAIAALMVLGYHVYLRSSPDPENAWDIGRLLNLGVPIFFVLSGFLLYRPFASARLDGRRMPSIGRYAKRRFFRVIPGYWVALSVFALLIPAWVDVIDQDAWIYYGLVETWGPGHTIGGLSPGWSLS